MDVQSQEIPLPYTRFQALNAFEWLELQRRLFPVAIPNRATWEELDAIADVLNKVGKPNLNHMLLPFGGGMDLIGAEASDREPGCIELLTDGTLYLVKPVRLIFDSFRSDPQWSYFWLETRQLEPTGIGSIGRNSYTEELMTVGDEYVSSSWTPDSPEPDDDSETDSSEAESLPEEPRRIARCLRPGNFLIVQKTCPYNRDGKTYDARHNKVSLDEFRVYLDGRRKAARVR
ncbi:MAG: hypothetical protein JWO19_1941 [Bryobacterales bacterium]|nr:hypothetical protein [Bryobacterales bacterium]